ncbi:MAG: heavy metal translocating P-type ATPase [Treponema sp.]|nr:heavy metal translocating P-type ATPase [Treponema sp.]
MERYAVTGMSCAACQARVEKAVSKLEGVTACSVSLLTNSMGVEGDVPPSKVIAAVKKAGYGARKIPGPPGQSTGDGTEPQSLPDGDGLLADRTSAPLVRRLVFSIVFLLVLMYVSMGHSMFGWPLPPFFVENHVAVALLEMLLAAVVMIINGRFFTSGFMALLHGGPNMDTLVALGSGVSFAYSTAVLFLMTGSVLDGPERLPGQMHSLYFESAAMIVALITLGKLLESLSKGRTTDALKALMRLSPKMAVLVRNGEEVEVPVSHVAVGDVFVVRPGSNIPVDGMVLEGNSAVDESALTGESVPVDKEPGSAVSAATVNRSGFLKCRATRIGNDTTLSQIIALVSEAAATKAPIAKIADRVSGVFVPAVIAVAAVTFAVWMFSGAEASFALGRAISVLVVSCPCALGLATPVAIMVAGGVGAKNGILFKSSAALEEAARIRTVALDKTGTITSGIPRLTDIVPADGVSEEELLQATLDLESKSEHPLAKAVLDFCGGRGMRAGETTDFAALGGKGLRARASDGGELLGGSLAFVSERVGLPAGLRERADALGGRGRTPLLFARGERLLGILAVADTVRPDSADAVREMKALGLRVVMLTGDNELTARAIGKEAGVDEIVAGVLPAGKEEAVRSLQRTGKVAMVGDGINDAPALTRADLGMAIGAGTDVAVSSADVVLMGGSLVDVVAAIRLGRATLANIRENLFWAFFYNVILIPIAAGVWYRTFGLKMNPMFGAAAMSLSSFTVCMNALRLNLVDIRADAGRCRHSGRDRNAESAYNRKPPVRGKEKKMFGFGKEKEVSERTLKVEGLMCCNCEKHVKEALEKVGGIVEATASHEKGEVVIRCNKPVSDDKLRDAIEGAGYKMLG